MHVIGIPEREAVKKKKGITAKNLPNFVKTHISKQLNNPQAGYKQKKITPEEFMIKVLRTVYREKILRTDRKILHIDRDTLHRGKKIVMPTYFLLKTFKREEK